jgi:hypothetical protein
MNDLFTDCKDNLAGTDFGAWLKFEHLIFICTLCALSAFVLSFKLANFFKFDKMRLFEYGIRKSTWKHFDFIDCYYWEALVFQSCFYNMVVCIYAISEVEKMNMADGDISLMLNMIAAIITVITLLCKFYFSNGKAGSAKVKIFALINVCCSVTGTLLLPIVAFVIAISSKKDGSAGFLWNCVSLCNHIFVFI